MSTNRKGVAMHMAAIEPNAGRTGLTWHRYPDEKPPQTGRQYLVRRRAKIGGYRFAVDEWAGTTWWYSGDVTHWAEIEGPNNP